MRLLTYIRDLGGNPLIQEVAVKVGHPASSLAINWRNLQMLLCGLLRDKPFSFQPVDFDFAAQRSLFSARLISTHCSVDSLPLGLRL